MHATRVLLILASVGALHGCSGRKPRGPVEPPRVAGVGNAGLDARQRGEVLLEELGCVACHVREGVAASTEGSRGPVLATVGGRVEPEYLVRFLADPKTMEPGTPMPDLLRHLDDAERLQAAAALAHYLRSFAEGAPVAPVTPGDAAAATRGRQLFHTIGCALCHAPRDEVGREQALPDSVPLGDVYGKYGLPALREFLLAPHQVRPSLRMPDMQMTPAEATDLAEFLRLGATTTSPTAAPIDAEQVRVGRQVFAERGCVACHALPDAERPPSPTAPPLGRLDPTRGCLSPAEGSWPFHALTDEQRADLTTAIRSRAEPTDNEARIRHHLVARNCVACHRRSEIGGIADVRQGFVTSTEPGLGEEGRVPPPLTLVGAKLQKEWLADTIAHGQAIRPGLRVRMPGFGKEFATDLTELLAATDTLPPISLTPLPADDKAARAVRDLGRELVGDQGMSCITCHLFAGERVGAMAAVDLVDSTAQRLRPEWFLHFLRTPLRFKPQTLMPQFFADGVSTRPALADGDVTRQTEAIWHYLAEGRNVGKPRGIRRPPLELVVGDEAVLLRRSVQGTGKRGISVGYPGGVNLTFDAERLGLNQIWWGRFVDATGVWTGQGSGEARILGKELVSLPNGPAFVVLADAAVPWPSATRRELGQVFSGYDLDAQQRPTFRYVCDGVTIADKPQQLAIDGQRPALRRTLTLSSLEDRTICFRAAAGPQIDDLGEGVVQVGASLRLRLPPQSFAIHAFEGTRELRVAIPIVQGRAELVIDYTWSEGR